MIIKAIIRFLVTVLIYMGGYVLLLAIINSAFPKGANWVAYVSVGFFVGVLARKLVDYKPA